MQYPLPPLDLRIEVGQPKDAGEKHWKVVCDHAERCFRFLAGRPQKHWNVLDVGCGCGRLAVNLVDEVEQYTGIEVQKRFVDWCRENINKGHFYYYDFHNHMYNKEGSVDNIEWANIEDSSQDVVYMSSVITHMRTKDFLSIMDESYRVLKNGGKLVFSCFVQSSASKGKETVPYGKDGILPIDKTLDEVSWTDDLNDCRYIVYKDEWIKEQFKIRGFNPNAFLTGFWGGREVTKGERSWSFEDRYQDWFCWEKPSIQKSPLL